MYKYSVKNKGKPIVITNNTFFFAALCFFFFLILLIPVTIFLAVRLGSNFTTRLLLKANLKVKSLASNHLLFQIKNHNLFVYSATTNVGNISLFFLPKS